MVHYQYDSLGRQATVIDSSGTWSHTYDADGRLATRTHAPSVGLEDYTFTYSYDLIRGLHTRTTLTDFTYANSVQTAKVTEDTQYAYDDLGRLIKVTVGTLGGVVQSPTLVTTYGYDAAGNRTSEQLPNGTYTLYGYDTMNRLTKLQSWPPSVAVANRDDAHAVMVQVYTVGVTGRRDAVHEVFRDDTGAVTADATTNWIYDNLNRITSEVVTNTAATPVELYHSYYTYDLVGNRMQKLTNQAGQSPQVDYTYDHSGGPLSDDRLMTETGTGNSATDYGIQYTYDNNGSLTNKNRTGANPETDLYGYDLRNRMTGSTVTPHGGANAEVTVSTNYGYDPDGLRTTKAVTIGVTTTSTTFVEDTNNPTGYGQVAEEQNSTTHAITIAYDIGQEVDGQSDTSGMNYLLVDGHGSTRLELKSDGSLLKDGNNKIIRYDYDAFGNAVGFVPTSARTNYLYTGEQFDAGVKQYYLRARYMDPSTGRFNQQDSYGGRLVDPVSLHRYVFANGNPINGRDPSGNFTLIEQLAVIGIIAILLAILLPNLPGAKQTANTGRLLVAMTEIVRFIRMSSEDKVTQFTAVKPDAEGVDVGVTGHSLEAWKLPRTDIEFQTEVRFLYAFRWKDNNAPILLYYPRIAKDHTKIPPTTVNDLVIFVKANNGFKTTDDPHPGPDHWYAISASSEYAATDERIDKGNWYSIPFYYDPTKFNRITQTSGALVMNGRPTKQ